MKPKRKPVFLKLKVKDKIKSKFSSLFFRHSRKKGLILAVFVMLGLFANIFVPNFAYAAVYNKGDIQVNMLLSDNFFRTYDGGSVPADSSTTFFQYTLNLTAPSKLTFFQKNVAGSISNSDTVDYLTQQKSDYALGPLGIDFLSSQAMASSCSTLQSTGLTSYFNASVVGCAPSIPGKTVKAPGGTWAGVVWNSGTALSDTITLSSASLKGLGITNASASGTVSSFYVCISYSTPTYILYDPANCKQVFVQLYDNQVDYNAHKADARPSTVPGNGSVTSSPNAGNTTGLTGLINDIITAVASFIIKILYWVFSLIILPFITAILGVHPYQDSFVNVIYVGWQILRNVANIVFIIAVIVMGIATILRASGYEYKHLLIELIIAALLVNFSLVIGQSILALADTVQHQFLPNNKTVINTLAKDVMPTNVQEIVSKSDYSSDHVFGTALQTVFIMAMAIGAFGVFAAIAVYLCIRVIAIWLLLMVAPLAYAARVLPSTHHFEQEWWTTFIKYAFFTPLMAFFLNLTAVIADQYPNILNSINNSPDFYNTGNSFVTMFLAAGSNIILLVFLYASLKVAEDFGIWGAHTITDIAQQGMFAPFKVAGAIAGAPLVGAKNLAQAGIETGVGYVGYKKTQLSTRLGDKGFFGKAAFAVLNPGAMKKAFGERREERHHAIDSLATGTASDIVHGLPGFKEETPSEREHAMMHIIEEEAKKTPYISERATFDLVKALMDSGNKDELGRAKVWAQIKNLAEEKGMNYTLLNAKKLGFDKNYAASYDGFLEFMNDMESKGWATPGEIGHIAPDLGKIAYKNREYWYAEGQYAHGAHTILINTEKDAKGLTAYDDEGKPKIVGEQAWKWVHDEEAVNRKVEEEVQHARAQHTGPEPFDENTARIRARAEVIEHRSHEVDHDAYANYEAYVKGQEEIYSNYTKMQPQAKARDGHWSTEVEVFEDKNGIMKNKMSVLGVAHMATADSGDFGQGGQLQLKKRREFQAAFRQSKDVIKQELEDKIYSMRIQEAQDRGEVIDQARKDQVRQEAKALRDFRYAVFEKYYVDGDKFEKGNKEKMITQFSGANADPEVKAAFDRLDDDLKNEILKHI